MIELIAVLGTVTLLTGLLLVYNRAGQNQLTLFAERSKLLSTIIEAKGLGIQTFSQTSAPCGYGVVILTETTYAIFRNNADTSSNGVCDDIAYGSSLNIFDGPVPWGSGRDSFHSGIQTLNPAVRFAAGTIFPLPVLFIPPDPTTIYLDSAFGDLVITLETVDGSISESITINEFGQITI